MEMPVFRVERRAQDRLQILVPNGRITLGQNVKELRQAIDQVASEGHPWLLLDMTDVPYVDSAGLGAIITGLNLFRKIDGDLLLANLQPRITQLVELTNLHEVLKVFPSAQAAIESIPNQAQASAL